MTTTIDVLAATPPMGWNSWDCFGTTVTEAEVLANAEVLRDRLSGAGWNTVVVDIAWYDPHAKAHGYNAGSPIELDGYGRQLPAPARFPSATDGAGFARLAARLHSMGLRFGVHIMRGIPRRAVDLNLPILGTEWTARDVADPEHVCAWNPDNLGLKQDHPGAQAYYDSQVDQFADWGVDYIKADDMLAPYATRDIEAYQRAILRSGRPMILSLSPGTQLSPRLLPHLRANAQLWRISDDLWDRWEDVHAQFARLAHWARHQQTGGWADADMLPVGRIGVRAERGEPRDSRLTPNEQQTMLTLWAMGRSPLMVGADLPHTDEATLARLANPTLGAVLASTTSNAELLREPADGGELIVWGCDQQAGNRRYVAVFWTGNDPYQVSLPFDSLVGLDERGPRWRVRDLWAANPESWDAEHQLVVTIPPHGVRWLELTPVE